MLKYFYIGHPYKCYLDSTINILFFLLFTYLSICPSIKPSWCILMYVCVYIYIHIYMCMCVYTHTHIYIYIYIYNDHNKAHEILFPRLGIKPSLSAVKLWCPNHWACRKVSILIHLKTNCRSRGMGHMYTYCWFLLMFGRNQHNSVKQLSFN